MVLPHFWKAPSMTAVSLSRVVTISLAHLSKDDHATAITQIVAIEACAPDVWVVKTATFRHTLANTGWLVVFLPASPVETHPGGECVQGFYCIDYATEGAAFKAAKTLSEWVAS